MQAYQCRQAEEQDRRTRSLFPSLLLRLLVLVVIAVAFVVVIAFAFLIVVLTVFPSLALFLVLFLVLVRFWGRGSNMALLTPGRAPEGSGPIWVPFRSVFDVQVFEIQ